MRTGLNDLYIPGPTNWPEAVRQAMNVPMQDMRAPDFGDLTLDLFEDLKKVFRTTTGTIMMFPGAGTAAWEAAITNTLIRIGYQRSNISFGTGLAQLAGQVFRIGHLGDLNEGSSLRDILELFQADPETDAVMMIGEIGGPQEADAAAYVRDHMTKPVIACVAGLSAPRGRQMGHAGAIISAVGESAQEKIEILSSAGITVAQTPSAMGETVARVLGVKAAA